VVANNKDDYPTKNKIIMNNRQKIIENYIEGYNNFDVDKMIIDFAENFVFENIQDRIVNMSLNGIEEFVKQAEKAKKYFINRTQTVNSFEHFENKTTIEISYKALLAINLPSAHKKGEELNLNGKSIFEFDGNKIIKLTDIS
jgi:hypothetical protein